MRTTYFDNSRFPLALIATALPLLLAACGGGGGGDNGQPTTPTTPTTPTGPQAVAIEFAAKAGSLPAKCGTPIAGMGTSQATVDLHDLRFYVSGVSLINDKGEAVAVTLDVNDWQTKEVTLIDLEDGTGACADAGTQAQNTQVRGTVPAGTYKGIRMTVGVPSSVNHTDYAVAPKPLEIGRAHV